MSKNKKTNFSKLFDKIINEIPENANVINKDMANNDDDPIMKEYIKKEKLYTTILEDVEENYKETHKQKRKLKKYFFWTVLTGYLVTIFGSLIAIIISLINMSNVLAMIVGGVASIISSIIAIPIVIAKYLFPQDEDKDLTSIINKMQNYDNNKRKIESENNKDKKDS